MAQQTMYPAQVNSLLTEIAEDIDSTQTTITVQDASVLPPAPNLLVIGSGEDAETVLYTGVSGDDLTGVTRGFQGAAKAWQTGVKVGRFFTAYDHDAFRGNIEDHEATLAAATNEATPSTLVQRDSAGRFKAAAPTDNDHVARKAETDAASTAAQAAQFSANAAQSTADNAKSIAESKLANKKFTSGTYDFNNRGNGSFIEEIKNNSSITIQNGPPGFSSGAMMQTESSHGMWLEQLVFEQAKFNIWFRYSSDNSGTKTWSAWAKLWNSENDGQNSGMDADTLRTYQPSVNSVGNTVVIRLPDGDINTNGVSIYDGKDLRLFAAGGSSDAGDIVFYDGSANEIGRFWFDHTSNKFMVRPAGTGGYDLWTTQTLRVNNGVLEFWYGGSWHPVGGSSTMSVQRGTAVLGSNDESVDVAIAPVNMEKTFTSSLGSRSTSADRADVTVALVNSDTLRVERNSSTGETVTISWEVIESQ